jgi:UDP-glucose 4-epimerase
MNQKKSVIVTGGAGFIGSHLVDALINDGESVIVVDNLVGGHLKNLEQHKNQELLEFVDLDVVTLNPSNSIFKNVSKVFHLAGIGDIIPSIERPLDYFRNNVQGTVNILEATRVNNIESFVYAASSSCYGFAKTPTAESHEIDPRYPYALTKYIGEQTAFHWSKVYGIKANSICIFNAYGPRVRTTGAYGAVFGVFFKQKLAGKPLTIVGDGEQQRDFVFVTDVAQSFIYASNIKNSGQRFNIGGGDPKKIIELATLIGGEKIFIPSRPGEPEITHANITKAQDLLGWKPKVSFEVGVKKMLNDIESWNDAPLWTPETIADATKIWFKYLGKSEV